MKDQSNRTYLEILRMAKEIVMQEYVDTRAQSHNKWLIESDHLWRTQKLRLAYPEIPAPPTENDIIQRAQTMLNFVKKDQVEDAKPAQPWPIPDPAPMPVPPLPADQENIDDAKSQDLEVDKDLTVQEKLEKMTIDQMVGKLSYRVRENETVAGRILPSVLKKIEDFKSDWKK